MVKGLLSSRMGLSLRIPLADYLNGSVLVEQAHGDVTRLVDQALHLVTFWYVVQPGKVQILGEPVVAEVALLQRRAALEHQSAAKRRHLADTGQNPGQEVVTFKYFPGSAETSTRFLEARPKRSHASTIPGRFSWTIQRLLHGPLRGPVGSSIR